jgi:serine/threonine protein kinase
MPKAGDVLAGRYRVEKYLGQGSLCNTFLCRDLEAKSREVVFKAMHPRKAAEPGLAESFLFLAQSVAKYDRRGIAKTYDSGTFAGVPYYTMEWVSGMPLRMWLMERLTFENRVLPGLGLVRSLIDVFEAIHELGCYGCLKPENVFVTLSGPVVTDFGVVGFLSPQEFEFNSYARRYLPYMAPEVRQDWSNLIPHSDYYSLGAILYEILAGRAPGTPLRLPSELSDHFGIEADEVVLKALAPKPLDRFGTLEAFRSAVESLQASMLAGSSAGIQPGSEGSRSMQIASEASMVHNPDESFQAPPAPASPFAPAHPAEAAGFGASDAVPSPFAGSGLNGHGSLVSGASAGSEPPGPDSYRTPGFDEAEDEERIRSAFPTAMPSGPKTPSPTAMPSGPKTPSPTAMPSGSAIPGEILDPREGEAAHSMRRFATPSAAAIPEASAPVVAAGFASSPASVAIGAAYSAPGAWVEAQGAPGAVDSADTDAREEPIPAWLWISIALAGCCMVVLSAYFGLLLPQN